MNREDQGSGAVTGENEGAKGFRVLGVKQIVQIINPRTLEP